MSQKTDAELLTQAGIIKNETMDGANTATRIGAMYDNIIDSKINNESVGPLIAATTGKTTPVDGDSTMISDSAASGAQKKLTWANLKATLKTYFDSIYQAALGYTAENSANKTSTIAGNESSTTVYASVKGVVDWVKDGLTGVLAVKGSIGVLDSFIINDQADSNKTKTATFADLLMALAGTVIAKISGDVNNDVVAGSDSGVYYKEWKNGRDEIAGASFLVNDPVVCGTFNGAALNPNIDINSVQVFLNGTLQTYAFADIVWNGTDLLWGKVGGGANIVVYWRYKL